jgi:hypothetical protein
MATKIWGPLGWMTLHSISAIYPEKPSYEDMQILKKFMELFSDTITCPDCKSHFSKIFESYKSSHPSWFASRTEFFLFVVRAHNTVNLRLDKPRIATVSECINILKANTVSNSSTYYRNSYVFYLLRNWSVEHSGEAFILSQSAREMIKINNNYWTPRDKGFTDLVISEADILTPIVNIPMRQNYFTGHQVQTSTKLPTHVRVSFITNKLRSVLK